MSPIGAHMPRALSPPGGRVTTWLPERGRVFLVDVFTSSKPFIVVFDLCS